MAGEVKLGSKPYMCTSTAIQMTFMSLNLEFLDQLWTTLTSYLKPKGQL